MTYRQKREKRKQLRQEKQQQRVAVVWQPPPPLEAKNARQKVYLKHLRTSPQVFTLGLAGTGKTYLAAAVAAEKFVDGKIKKIILTRPAVGVDEEHGFLPGSVRDKLAPWLTPFVEVLEQRMGKARYTQAVKDGYIEIVPLAFMRGRTFSDAFVLLDEAQNCTYRQLHMFLTRLGENCTVVVNGDVQQTDLDKDSGLKPVLDMIQRYNLPVPVVEFTKEDVVRSAVCAMWAEGFERYESDTRRV